MNTSTILRLLENSGFHNVRADTEFVYMEDPSCILRSFETFLEYAWVGITALTGFLLAGWALSKIYGAKDDIFTNMKNLMLIFGILSVIKPVMNVMYGSDLFRAGCKEIRVSIAQVNVLLDKRKDTLGTDRFNLYEDIDIYDSGADIPLHELPYSAAPISGSGSPAEISTTSVGMSGISPIYADAQSISAYEMGKDVIYTQPDGAKVKYTGGSRAWRNSNPGNIRYSDFAKRVGAIGQAGGFAVFPDEQTGMYAIEALLRTQNYNKLTIAGAISRYAPPNENNTAGYQRHIQKLTGLSINKRMSDLNAAELRAVANAIRVIEGWEVGNVQRIE